MVAPPAPELAGTASDELRAWMVMVTAAVATPSFAEIPGKASEPVRGTVMNDRGLFKIFRGLLWHVIHRRLGHWQLNSVVRNDGIVAGLLGKVTSNPRERTGVEVVGRSKVSNSLRKSGGKDNDGLPPTCCAR